MTNCLAPCHLKQSMRQSFHWYSPVFKIGDNQLKAVIFVPNEGNNRIFMEAAVHHDFWCCFRVNSLKA